MNVYRITHFIAAAYIALLTLGCSRAYEPEPGDLLFAVSPESIFTDAIVAATAPDSIPFAHVAIAGRDSEGNIFVVEALPANGVAMRRLDEFLSAAAAINGKPAVVAMRVNRHDVDCNAAVSRALTYVGKPYDWHFAPGNNMFYCTELVQTVFLDNDGYEIFPSIAMNFLSEDGEMPQFWIDLFARFNEPIPQGEPGTNPAAMSRDRQLTTVHRYF